MSKKIVCMVLVMLLLLPAVALAKSYDSVKIYNGNISTTNLVFKAGDVFTSNSRISVEIIYTNAAGEKMDEGKGTIKSVTIDGEKVTEWIMSGSSGAIIQVGSSIYQAAFGFTLKPAYAAADSEGYYSILSKTYKAYMQNAKDKKVKLTGDAVAAENGFLYVSIAENLFVAIKTDQNFNPDERIVCKGTISDYCKYQGMNVPVVAPEEISLVTSVTARIEVNDLYVRNRSGAVITGTKKGEYIEVLEYDPSCDMFSVAFGSYSGYIKGTGLNISRNELLSYFK